MIIKALKQIHSKHRLNIGNVSEHTKSAQLITKEWQQAVCGESVKSEVNVSPENNERIDIVNFKDNTAYELKVSGKNTHHEFYKDLIKVLTFNENNIKNKKLSRFIFISESSGIKSLEGRLDSKFITMLRETHGLSVELVSI